MKLDEVLQKIENKLDYPIDFKTFIKLFEDEVIVIEKPTAIKKPFKFGI